MDPYQGGTPIRGIVPTRDLTDFAQALSLLGGLFRGHPSEDAACQGIMDAVQMLFTPDHVRILALNPASADVLHVHGESAVPASEAVRKHFAACEGTHLVSEDGASFVFRLAVGSDTVGFVDVSRVAIPNAVPSYLNLALTIAPVCAAVVAGARAYDEVREERASVERSRFALQSANEELASLKKQLRTLQGVFPTCAWCKGIIDEAGAGARLSAYLAAYPAADSNHGICANCQGNFRANRTERDRAPTRRGQPFFVARSLASFSRTSATFGCSSGSAFFHKSTNFS